MKNIISFFIKYPVWAHTLKILIFIFGFMAIMNMKYSFFPEMEQLQINIQLIYPGASPEEMELGVIQKIEDNIKGIQGIERFTSLSEENKGSITIEIFKEFDVDEVLQDVMNAVDRINSFPVGLEPPVVAKAPTVEFAISFTLSGDVDIKTLKNVARSVEDDLRDIEGISQVSVSGFPEEEIVFYLSEEKMQTYGISFTQVSNAVRSANIDLSAGAIKSKEEEFLIRFKGKRYYGEELQEVIVKAEPDGKLVRVSDIARVENTWAETPEKTFVNKQRSVIFTINKIIGEDILFITSTIKDYVEDFNAKNPTIKASILHDFSVSLKQRRDMLVKNGIAGIILVIASLALFLNVRLAFWVALGIPFSFFGMFIASNMFGMTINVISLFGSIIVIGILVDDGIVVSEQIYQYSEKGEKPFRAALFGTLNVLKSITFAIITSIAMFIPFFFFDGRQGRAMWDMAFVVIFTLGISLIEAALILPAHLAHSKALKLEKTKSEFRIKLDKILEYPRDKWYSTSLKFFMRNKAFAFGIVIIMTLATFGAFKGGIIGVTFMPYIDSDSFDITVEMPAGTREDVTETILDRIQDAALEVKEELREENDGNDVIKKVVKKMANITGGSMISRTTSSGSNIGTVQIVMVSEDLRPFEGFVVSNRIREKVGIIHEAEKILFGGGSIFGKPIAISLISRDLEELEKAKTELKADMAKMTQLKDIVDNDPQGLREIDFKLKEKAYMLGLNSMQIASQIRQGFFGDEVQRLQRNVDEIKVWVKYDFPERSSLENLENMRIRLANGNEYPLKELIDYKIERGSVKINHLNGKREIRVDADLIDQNDEVPPLLAKITDEILPPILAKYPSIKVTDSGQKREIMKTARSASKLLISFILMYFLIVLSFRSFYQGLVVLALVPFGFIGAAWGHFIYGMPVNIMSFYGIIALIGVFVNDSIVYVNTLNGYLKEGRSFYVAVYDAGINRFRPILLTTLTTVLGLMPLLLETSRQAQFLIPMAISVAWGMIFGTFFILIMLPVLLITANRLHAYMKWIITGRKPSPEEIEPAVVEEKELEYYKRGF